jgi:hypothetical protein
MFKKGMLVSAALAIVMLAGNTGYAEILTGCLSKKGQIINLLEGPTPTKPCRASETEVSLQTGDAQKFIFVTDSPSNGNLGGLTGADSTCQSDADAASLPGVYKAWLSLTTVGPQSTFVPARVPYVLPGSFVVVANDWTELTSGTLANAIDRHADGTLITAGQEFWTGTRATGLPFTAIGVVPYPEGQAVFFSCDGWVSEIQERSGTVGTSEAVDSTWSEGTELTCDTELRHICVQQ